jgi:hypothetical protein
VVNKDAGELVADGAVDKGGGYRRINPSREGTDNLALTYLLLDFGDAFRYKVARCPVPLTAAYPVDEIF